MGGTGYRGLLRGAQDHTLNNVAVETDLGELLPILQRILTCMDLRVIQLLTGHADLETTAPVQLSVGASSTIHIHTPARYNR